MITTNRLNLLPLTLDQLKTGLQSTETMALSLNLLLVPNLFTGVVERAVHMKIEKMSAADNRLHDWYTYWLIIIKEENTGVGMVGFKGPPNEKESVEIGYGLDDRYRGKGFMSEAVSALIDWAFSHSDCSILTATHVLKDNFGSQKVLFHNGFVVNDETPDRLNFVLTRQNFKSHQ